MKTLDKINRNIINILQENSAITNAELAYQIGLAPASTLERVRKLEKSGIITKYVALVEGKKIDKGTVVYAIIHMKEHSIETIKQFNSFVQGLPEVLECHRLAGDKDYILKIVTRDIQSYEAFSIDKLAKIPGIARINTSFVLSSPKENTKIPIEEQE
jgi:Lrp/AsnC family leucine-responsive transcriptional regulator